MPESGSVSVSGSIGFCSQLYTPLTEDDFQYLYDYSGEMWEYRRLLAISEEMFLKEISTGASDDLKRATRIARSMVTEYGMSELGPVQYEEKSEGVFLGRDYTKSKNFSDQVALEIDQQTRKIIETCYDKAKKIIADNKDLIFQLSDALMKYETITKEQIESIVKTGKIKPEDAENLEAEEKKATTKSKKNKATTNEDEK